MRRKKAVPQPWKDVPSQLEIAERACVEHDSKLPHRPSSFSSRSEYLPDATSFVGFSKHERPENWSDAKYLCPRCHGYGGWNLRLNAYGDGSHFNAHCGQCNGWGWVVEADRDCIHEFAEISQAECRERGIQHWGSCWHVCVCSKCGRVTAYDSSD